MNVFILSTGRCGSTTFVKACNHIRNFTSAHESRVSQLGDDRLNYPDNHIEIDNRLSWFLGRLEQKYGDHAFYVHLKRDRLQIAQSYSKRFIRKNGFIMIAYSEGIYFNLPDNIERLEIALDYYDTVTANIEAFLHNKSNKLTVSLESIEDDFQLFWEKIGAEGDLSAALKEWDINYNSSTSVQPTRPQKEKFIVRFPKKIVRIFGKLPEFITRA